jgi:hypothetical protein
LARLEGFYPSERIVIRRGERFYWRTLWVFFAGITANALYGFAQLGVARDPLAVRKATVDASVHRLERAVQRLEGLSEPRRRPRICLR